MRAALPILAYLRRRGVRVTAKGELLRLDAPSGVLSLAEVEVLREIKPALLAALAEEEWPPAPDPRAWLLSTPYGRVWIAADPEAAAELLAEEGDWERLGEPALPVLMLEEFEKLRGTARAIIRATLDALAVFPGLRVVT